MKCALLLPLILMASPAHAEHLAMDYRLYPPLKAVLDSNNADAIQFEDARPRYVLDRIVTQGNARAGSLQAGWSEALEIYVRSPQRTQKTVADWYRSFQQQEQAACPSEWTIIEQSETSITVARSPVACGTEPVRTRLYRTVFSRKWLYQLVVIRDGALPEEARRQWLDVLASAHVEK